VLDMPAGVLATAVNRRVSRYRADEHRRELQDAAGAHEYAEADCAACGCVIDLAGLPATDFIYCSYCRSILRAGGRIAGGSPQHRVCPQCLLFDRVQVRRPVPLLPFTRARGTVEACSGCAVRHAGRALARNLLTVVGVLPALGALVRARGPRSRHWPDLHRANALARAGLYEQADGLYRMMLHGSPQHPGLLLNQAVARANGGERAGAREYVERALDACASYEPARDFAQILDILEGSRPPA
jgi:hypothetical protein